MKKTLFLFFFAGGMLIAGCRKKNEDPYIRFNQQAIIVEPDPGAFFDLAIESNIAWHLSTDADWLELSKTTGSGKDTIRITVIEPNPGSGSRNAVITAESAGNSPTTGAQLTVEQKPFNLQMLARKTRGGDKDEIATGIAAAADDGHVIVGYTNSNNSGDVRAGFGGVDYWVAKINSNQDTVWTRVLGGPGHDEARAVATTPDGGFVVAGHTGSAGSGQVPAGFGDTDIWLVKLTADGNIAWTRTLGGLQYDAAFAVTVTSDGNIALAGATWSSDISMNLGSYHGNRDILVMKLTAGGDLLWSRTLGGSSFELAYGITADPEGGVVCVGQTQSSNSGDVWDNNRGMIDLWAVRLRSNGDTAWTRLLGGSDDDVLRAIASSPGGGFVAVGQTKSRNSHDIGTSKGGYDCLVLKLNANGGAEWMQFLGGTADDYGYALAMAPDGNQIIAGLTLSANGDLQSNNGEGDGFVAKLDASGRKLWSTNRGGAQDDYFYGVSLNANGSFTIAGFTESSNSGDVNTANRGQIDWWTLTMKDQ